VLAELLDPAGLPEADQPVILALLEATDRMVDAIEILAGVIGRVPAEEEHEESHATGPGGTAAPAALAIEGRTP
jgi:hypothetical protein